VVREKTKIANEVVREGDKPEQLTSDVQLFARRTAATIKPKKTIVRTVPDHIGISPGIPVSSILP
jgi:hypothetical protein